MRPNQENVSRVQKSAGSRADRQLDLKVIRSRLAGANGPAYWRSLEELAGTVEFREMLHREFPDAASEWENSVSRRDFLKLAGASLALAGLTACTKQPTQEIYPYVNQPAELVLGEPLFYASSMILGGYATGVLVKSREGHPIKVDGNPDHPASLGGSSVWLQASILDLYDPDRSQAVLHNGDISTYDRFLTDLNELLKEQHATQGAGLRFLTQTVTSPTLGAQLEDLHRRFPKSNWHQYEPVTRDNVRAGAHLAFGEVVEAQYQFDAAAVIVSLESDFLHTHPERLRYARQFANGRRVAGGQNRMNRLYVVESSPTITGSMADHRLRLASTRVEELAKVLCNKLGQPIEASTALPTAAESWLEAMLSDLHSHRGDSIVIAGESQPPVVHALAHFLNEHLGNVGKTVFYADSAETHPVNQTDSLRQLAAEIRAGAVEALVILAGNPAYTAPVDLEFGELLLKTKRSIYLGLQLDETAARCTWHIPAKHYLESWGDARSFDGTVSFVQPLVAPLYGGKSAHELLGAFVQEQPLLSDYEIVRNFWRAQNRWPDFESGWREALHNGYISNSARPRKQMRPQTLGAALSSASSTSASSAAKANPAVGRGAGLEICFRPDPNLWDGRFANNGWLQECPKPLSKLTWGNAALISPALAEQHGLNSGDVIVLNVSGRNLKTPVWVMPGQADQSITLHLGYGRERVGRVGTGVGANAYLLRTTESPWVATGAQLLKAGYCETLVSAQGHHSIDSPERQVLRACTWEQFQSNPHIIKDSIEEPSRNETLYDTREYHYDRYKWGMSIDLTTCIGCNACLVACQAENNIPFVGKEQVRRHREMFWIRVDTYYGGSLEEPRFTHMPVPCMHCEHAPCELVCPVAATVHDAEGLNLQVYNRCVGTRFCSNNCPYKVRRFNFFQYAQYHQPSYKPMYNPEVTVRWRGVMEKCTYCIQRISAARINAEKQNRRIGDEELQSACQQACPANAIVFGDLNNPRSQVTRLKKSSLDYPMLGQLNTRPRTTYLAKVENPKEESPKSQNPINPK